MDPKGTKDEGFPVRPENGLKVDAKYHSHKEPNVISDNHVWESSYSKLLASVT
jgi:hypothetical protein